MSGHTKGRLRLDRGQVVTERGDLLRTNGTQIPMVAGPDRLESLANMQRIVALWNAAEELGLTTEAIEAGVLGRAFAALTLTRDACLFADDDGGIGVTTDPYIDPELFECICDPLRSLITDPKP